MKILKFNSKGLPIGPGAGRAALVLGKLVRSQIPIRFKRWTDAPKERKDLMWETLRLDLIDERIPTVCTSCFQLCYILGQIRMSFTHIE
ncbi:hypothetical protein ACHQM5_012616 [Ranunculus cassubicifolius]